MSTRLGTFSSGVGRRCFRLAVICGGPSRERGISLNSARSVMDHLQHPFLEVVPLYVDGAKRFYRLAPGQLYSNTPADFDFKIGRMGERLEGLALKNLLQEVDLVFPLIHGAFGEDGGLQAILEHFQVPFIGHSSASCRQMFHKHKAAVRLRREGFSVLPQELLGAEQQGHSFVIEHFFRRFALKRAVVKPAVGGSSIGVHSVSTPVEALERVRELLSCGCHREVILEPFCEGREFTIVVFEDQKGAPAALLPTELELDYAGNQIFDFRKKYLPTHQVVYHTPARFSEEATGRIRRESERLFKLFGMRDFVRLDGWMTSEGVLYFTDINPISGLEQNSFLFRQTALLGMTHREALMHVVRSACRRHGLLPPDEPQQAPGVVKKPVHVLFGDRNAERQVSLMSGANVWLKLLHSDTYEPIPFLVDGRGEIWRIPYAHALHHTVEEIRAECLRERELEEPWTRLAAAVRLRLDGGFSPSPVADRMSVEQFLDRSRAAGAFVFLALHGGEGEDGTWQGRLEAQGIPFNGSNAAASALCMDKYLAGQAILALEQGGLAALPKKSIRLADFGGRLPCEFEGLWQECCEELNSRMLIVKPRREGCSAGIALLRSAQDLECYCHFLHRGVPLIPPFSFAGQFNPIEMPPSCEGEYLLEPYIEVDPLCVREGRLHHLPKGGWLELTVGVLEEEGVFRALNPSITLAEGAALSVEEKFQGGSGINLTPPPETLLSSDATQNIKGLAERAAAALGIRNYARLDLFFNRLSGQMLFIEANTLPALTPSTVMYHQALAETPPLPPLDLLEWMITSSLNRNSSATVHKVEH